MKHFLPYLPNFKVFCTNLNTPPLNPGCGYAVSSRNMFLLVVTAGIFSHDGVSNKTVDKNVLNVPLINYYCSV